MGTPSLSLNITADTDSMILTAMKHFKTSGSSRIDPQLQIQNFFRTHDHLHLEEYHLFH